MLLLTGVAVWLTDGGGDLFQACWQVVSPCLVAGTVGMSLIEIRELESLPDPELSERENRNLHLIAVVAVIAFVTPALVINLALAYDF